MKIYLGIIVRQHFTDSETNGIAEWALRRVKEGTSAVLLQSGQDEKWWVDSMECYNYLRNIQDICLMDKHITNGDSQNHVRTNKSVCFDGRISPLFLPMMCGTKVLRGIFLGSVFHEMGIWKGDTVADIG